MSPQEKNQKKRKTIRRQEKVSLRRRQGTTRTPAEITQPQKAKDLEEIEHTVPSFLVPILILKVGYYSTPRCRPIFRVTQNRPIIANLANGNSFSLFSFPHTCRRGQPDLGARAPTNSNEIISSLRRSEFTFPPWLFVLE